ncbi:glycosyltransferase [Pengzhenrongella sicca]|uniref:Glycosyltransferase n=1 Tax=Pengzhenrongella sicca TaxID=2819238 RepID=A0A8A4ZP15_9MICO|nr:glycosyltransferase [Pengzhenrongella sicca]QTE31318.1 glycosyltransferase [Pengzhenrongella sicca]
MSAADRPEGRTHRLSVVIPVYQGEITLTELLGELDHLTSEFTTPDGNVAVVAEVLLVFDNGPDGSASVIRTLAEKYPMVRPVWLSRNFGQHAATLAGMASSGGDWIVTMDEDGQHDPADIGRMLDVAMRAGASVIYAKPENAAPHGVVRNAASKGAKRAIRALAGGLDTTVYQSYRLMLGEVGRSVAAYAGAGVYLDVALGWVAGDVATCPVLLRAEGGRRSGYNLRSLLSHFWRLVLSSGTRGLRVVSVTGFLFGVAGLLLAIVILVGRLAGDATPAGWTSMVIIVLLTTGAVLFSLGIVAEYIGVAVNMAMGKPLYLIVSDREAGPLGWHRPLP